MTVDTERVRPMLDRLRAAEQDLSRLRELGVDAVRGDTDRLNSVKYLFVVAAEVMIDTGQHVIAAEGLEAPTSFTGVFQELGRAGWLTDELAATCADIARFRNLLVHGYVKVDDDRVVAILHKGHEDLASFRQQIAVRLPGSA